MLIEVRNHKIVLKCYVYVHCHTAISSREELLLLHSPPFSSTADLRLWPWFSQAQEDQASTVLDSGSASPKPQDLQQLLCQISTSAVLHHHGDACNCHPDDETKLILLAFADP